MRQSEVTELSDVTPREHPYVSEKELATSSVGRFLTARTSISPFHRENGQRLYGEYTRWCRSRRKIPAVAVTIEEFIDTLGKWGFPPDGRDITWLQLWRR